MRPTAATTFWIVVLLLAGCSAGPDDVPNGAAATGAPGAPKTAPAAPTRWYDFDQVRRGALIFRTHCASCHGAQAEGGPNWREPGPDGRYPAPPLNGTGHGWHHPRAILAQVIKHGSPGGQGNMPAWGSVLSDDEVSAVIAWFQSRWSDEIYAAWQQRNAALR